MAVFFAVLISLVFLVGCGAKARPEAQTAAEPLAIKNIQVSAESGRLRIQWSLPAAEISKVAGVRIYRKHWPTGTADPAQIKTLLMGELPATKQSVDGRLVYDDRDIQTTNSYEYHLFAYDAEKKLGPDYMIGPFTPVFPTEQVKGLVAQAGDGVVQLSWMAVTGAVDPESGEIANDTGLRVDLYRAEGEQGPYTPQAINDKPLVSTGYEDYDVRPSKKMRYQARLVRIEKGVRLLGPLTPEVSVTVQDNTPPAAAQVLESEAIEGGVRLLWQPVPDRGLLGYQVLRRSAKQEPKAFAPVSGLLTVDEFTDRTVADPDTYVYQVIAIDRAGNRSQSAERSIVYPKPESPAPAPAPTEGTTPAAEEKPVAAPAATAAPATEKKPEAAPATTEAPAAVAEPKKEAAPATAEPVAPAEEKKTEAAPAQSEQTEPAVEEPPIVPVLVPLQ